MAGISKNRWGKHHIYVGVQESFLTIIIVKISIPKVKITVSKNFLKICGKICAAWLRVGGLVETLVDKHFVNQSINFGRGGLPFSGVLALSLWPVEDRPSLTKQTPLPLLHNQRLDYLANMLPSELTLFWIGPIFRSKSWMEDLEADCPRRHCSLILLINFTT